MPAATKDSQVSMRLPGELKDRVEAYAQLTGRSKSHVAMEALVDYLDWRAPQVADLKQALDAADAGDFATDAEVARVTKRLTAPVATKAAPRKTKTRRA